MSHVQDDLKKISKFLLNHYQHHLLWSGWEVGQSLADMKMWFAPAVSSVWVPSVDTCLRKGVGGGWHGEVGKGHLWPGAAVMDRRRSCVRGGRGWRRHGWWRVQKDRSRHVLTACHVWRSGEYPFLKLPYNLYLNYPNTREIDVIIWMLWKKRRRLGEIELFVHG